MKRKLLTKYVAVHLHQYGQNKHAFWCGIKGWMEDEEYADFYNDDETAMETSKLRGGKGDFIKICLEF